jgi:hypothetical protein
MDAAEHRLLANIREFDRQEGWSSAASCAHWLSWRVGWTLGTAREHVRVAKALGSLPHIDDALRLGKVSYCKVRAMTRVATPANEQVLIMDAQLTTGSQLERVCRKYRQLQRNLEGANPANDDLERYLRRRDLDNGMVRIEAVCHPEEAALIWAAIDQATKEVYAARHAEERTRANAAPESRADVSAEACSGSTSDDVLVPTSEVSAETCTTAASDESADIVVEHQAHGAMDDDPDDVYEDDCDFFERFGVCPEPRPEPVSRAREQHESAATATTSRAMPAIRPMPPMPAVTTHPSTATSRSAGNRGMQSPFNRLDGLLALVRKFACGESTKSPVEIVVTVSAEALANRAAPDESIAFLNDDGCISAEAARRMSCDAGIVYMVEDEHGSPLSVGRRTRSIPTSIGRALRERDKCCRFPGCTNKVFLDGHHLEHWALGGETALSNLVRLCGRHHKFVHEYGYRVEMDAAGQPQFFDPQGRPAKDIPTRILRDDLGWEHLVTANRELGISPHVCGWSGERIEYDDVCHALYRVDEGLLAAADII